MGDSGGSRRRRVTLAFTVILAAAVPLGPLGLVSGGAPQRLLVATPAPTTSTSSASTTSTVTPAPPTTATAAPAPTPTSPRATRVAAVPRPRRLAASVPALTRAPAPSGGAVAKAVWDVPDSGYGYGAPVVALTFDDGPDRWTPQILEVLRRYDAPATFFQVGRLASGQEDLVRSIVGAGHGIGNLTWNHVDLPRTSNWAREVDDTTRLLADMSGRAIGCLRPPFGAIDRASAARIRQRGLTPVLWDVDSKDYTTPGADVIAQRVLRATRPGSIILLHDGGGDRSQTVAALPRIIEGVRARGLRPVVLCRDSPSPAAPTTSVPPETTTSTTAAPETETTLPPEDSDSTTTTTAASP